MPFIKPLPHWEAPGIEPPLLLRQEGWKAGVKPPSDYFNYLQSRSYEALKELQENAIHKDEIDLTVLVTNEVFETHLEDYLKHTGYAVATGTVNNYVATLNPALSAYAEGVTLRLKVNIANTGASTLNVNGLGAKGIKKSSGSAVSAGNLKAGSIYTLTYDGTDFILQGEGGSMEMLQQLT